MPAPPTFPDVYVAEALSGGRTITGVSTSITLFVGWAPRGPVDRAVPTTSFVEYQRTFGDLDPRTPLGHAVKQFYDNGGSDAYIVRVVAAGCASSTAAIGDIALTASSPGLWGNGYAVRTSREPAPDDTLFKLDVLDRNNGDGVVESFHKLSPRADDARFAASLVNGASAFVTVNVSSGVSPGDTTANLEGGADSAVLTPGSAHFHAALADAIAVGSIVDQIELFSLVCVPAETDPAVLAALQTRCREWRAFLIADSDPSKSVSDYSAGAPSSLTGSDAMNCALYFPWVRG
ncbi:MAG: phage tail sheath family protein, partial [Caldimonas sp.]